MSMPYEIRIWETDQVIDPTKIESAVLMMREQAIVIKDGRPTLIYYVCPAEMKERPPMLIDITVASRAS